ncbi:MAG: signal recognition particle protein [Candidatus Aenigmarchaeota archaeon]|nr:signal recognition particle protein [Candidatus Aenigmarchaeota archaeon]
MVLQNFGQGLKELFRKIAGMPVVDENAIESIIKEMQRLLLQSDVDVLLVSQLSKEIRQKMLESKLPAGISMRDYFTKTLYSEIVGLLGREKAVIELKRQKILLVGLFGSGKTTTAGKLAGWFRAKGLSAALVACDTFRPAAKEQLRQIGQKINVHVYADGKTPAEIAKKAIEASKEDILIFDSAGRDALDQDLAKELKELAMQIEADEILLVLPADMGQVARKQAGEFRKLVNITGIIVTKLDGTAKGGAALAAAAVTGSAVKFIGLGEHIGDFELFEPERFVGRLIGYGDIKRLLEKAKEAGIEEGKAEKMLEGNLTMNDFLDQLEAMQKMGSLQKITEMIPGFSNVKLPAGYLDVQEEKMKKWKYVIQSMTKGERENPEIIRAGRIARISKGSGASQQDVRELLKNYKQTQKLLGMAKGKKALKRGPLASLAKQFGINMG